MNLSYVSKYRSPLMGIAILWVMLYHLLGMGAVGSIGKALLALGHGGVDIFLFLSGLGLTYSYFDTLNTKKNVCKYFSKRILRIIPTYYIVILITGICYHKEISNMLWQLSCIGFWIGKPYYEWYVPSLLVLYMIFPLFVKMGKKISVLSSIILFCVIGLLLSSILIYVGKGTPILFFSRIPVFFVGCGLGYYLSHHAKVQNESLMVSVLVAISIIALCFEIWLTMNYDSVFLRQTALHHLPFVLIVPGLLIALSFFFEKLSAVGLGKHFVVDVLSFLGVYSLEIYLVHMSLRYTPAYIYIPIAIAIAFILKQVVKKVFSYGK